jgi:multiple sugar transport system substrate-binding protein
MTGVFRELKAAAVQKQDLKRTICRAVVSRKGAKAQSHKGTRVNMTSRPSEDRADRITLFNSVVPLRLCAFARDTQSAARELCENAPRYNRKTSLFAVPYALFTALPLLLAGCGSNDPATRADPGKRLAGVKLQLVVVGDPAIAAEIRGLKEQWHAETGAEVEIVESNKHAILSPGPGGAAQPDAAIGPAYLLGPLAEAKRLAPVPHSIAREANGPWSQTFELLRDQDAVWGKEAYGVPLGSPVFCCYYRADLLDKLHLKPPQTWMEYEDMARRLRVEGAASGVRYGTVEPLARGWAGLVLLARAAAYAKQRDEYTTLFDEATFEPAIAGLPFVRALEELVAAAKLGPAEPTEIDPAAARAEFWKGNTAIAISWPSAAKATAKPAGKADGARSVTVRFGELPGAAEVYRPSSNSLEPRGDDEVASVPLLGVSGRVGVVFAGSQHGDAAFELLLWLTNHEWASRVFAASPATTLFRSGQVAEPAAWVESNVSAVAARQYAEQTAETLSRRQYLAALRIPGRAEYLAALDDSVQAAVKGEKKPAAALKTAAAKWREISQRLGVDRQRTAYSHSLGLE